jgi:PBP1b-binding outer membrane lipoprotein LpoB
MEKMKMAIRNILFTVVVILLLLSGCSANEQPSQQPKVSPEVTEEPQENSSPITVDEAGVPGNLKWRRVFLL